MRGRAACCPLPGTSTLMGSSGSQSCLRSSYHLCHQASKPGEKRLIYSRKALRNFKGNMVSWSLKKPPHSQEHRVGGFPELESLYLQTRPSKGTRSSREAMLLQSMLSPLGTHLCQKLDAVPSHVQPATQRNALLSRALSKDHHYCHVPNEGRMFPPLCGQTGRDCCHTQRS